MPIVFPDGFILDLEEKMNKMEEIRRKVGWTQQDIADRLGVHNSRVARWEAGIERPRFNTLVLLNRILDRMQLNPEEFKKQ